MSQNKEKDGLEERIEKFIARLGAESDVRVERTLKESNEKWEKANIRLEKERLEHKVEMERYLGGLSEDFQSKLDLVVEQYDSIIKKQDMHTEILERHEGILNRHTEILERHDRKLDSHTEMVGTMMEDISDIKDMLDGKAEKRDLIVLDRRVSSLELELRA